MKNAQIERLRTLKKMIASNVTIDVGAVLADLEELVDILLMEREGMADGVQPDPKARIE